MVIMNNHRIEEVKKCIENVIRWNELEEDMLKHEAKIDWLRLGDGNNSYFHASIKSNQNAKSVRVLYMEDGTNVTTQEDIENEVLDYYGKLMGRGIITYNILI